MQSTLNKTLALQKVPQRSPGALRSAPGEPPKPPQTTPGELSEYPWASKKTPGVVLGASEPHFGAPGARFTYFSHFSKPFLLSSLLFSFSLFSYMLFFSSSVLLSFLVSHSLRSRLSSRFSSVYPAVLHYWDFNIKEIATSRIRRPFEHRRGQRRLDRVVSKIIRY